MGVVLQLTLLGTLLTEIINFCLNMELPILLGLLWIGASITANPVYHRPQIVWQPTWPLQYSTPTVPVLYQPVHRANTIRQQNNYGMRHGRSRVYNNLQSYGSPLIRRVQSPNNFNTFPTPALTNFTSLTNFTRSFGGAGLPQWMGVDGSGGIPAGNFLAIGPSNILTITPLPLVVINPLPPVVVNP